MQENSKKAKISISRSILFTFIIIAFFLLVIVFLGEIGMRLFYKDILYQKKADFDKEIGWVCKAHVTDSYPMSSFQIPDHFYDVNYQTFDHGFRVWGNPESERTKVFFIGDSYVQSLEASNDKTFYSILGDSLGLEVFAYGQSGFGSLQQKLIIEKYFPIVKPDVVIWQTCDNDFIDNHIPLEINSSYKVGLWRPYYNLNGEMFFGSTNSNWSKVLSRSKFITLLRNKFIQTFNPPTGPVSQELIVEEGKKFKPYAESVEITRIIAGEIKSIVGETPILAFSASAYEPQLSDFKELCESQGIPFDGSPGIEIQQLRWHQKNVLSKDGYHWNEIGHRKVAEMLYEPLSSALNKTLASLE